LGVEVVEVEAPWAVVGVGCHLVAAAEEVGEARDQVEAAVVAAGYPSGMFVGRWMNVSDQDRTWNHTAVGLLVKMCNPT
jgi:hypothetical protein